MKLVSKYRVFQFVAVGVVFQSRHTQVTNFVYFHQKLNLKYEFIVLISGTKTLNKRPVKRMKVEQEF